MSKMLEVLKGLDDERIANFIDNEVKKVFIESFDVAFQGWRHDIIIDLDNCLYVTGALSYGQNLMSVYEGLAVVLGRVNCRDEINYEMNIEDLDGLGEEHIAEMIDDVKYSLFTDEELEKEITLTMCFNENSSEIENYVIEHHMDYYKELINSHIVALWDNYHRDAIRDEVIESKDNLIELLSKEN